MIMQTFKNIFWGIACGLWDSIKGMSLLLHIDNEIHRINTEKAFERRQRQRYQQRRSPSPAPSSASAMERQTLEAEYKERTLREHQNPDERHIESVLKTSTNTNSQEPKAERKIAIQVLKCCMLNGGFTGASIFLYDKIILPSILLLLTFIYGENSTQLTVIWGWIQSILAILFGMMWVLPIFLLSKIVSSLWFADIANAAYRIRKGRPQIIPNIGKLIADFLFSLLVQSLFLIQSMLLNFLPMRYVGQFLCFLHLCLLYSLYSFEYKWFNMGWELHRRLRYIESNWPYFLGFGIPLTVLTNMSNSIIVSSSCIFSIFFPLFILSGNEAKPIVGTTEFSLPLFTPVIFFANLLFKSVNKATVNENSGTHAANKTVNYDAQQSLLLQQQKECQRMLQQQKIEHEYRQLSLQREHKKKKQQQEFRYQQPPPLRVPSSSVTSESSGSNRHLTPERSVSRGHRYGGMRPLIPTPVPGAPTGVVSVTPSR